MKENNDKQEGRRQWQRGELRERKPNYQEYTATVEAIEQFLADHIHLRWNEVTHKVEYRVPEGDPFDRVLRLKASWEWAPMTDLVENSLYLAMKRHLKKRVSLNDMKMLIHSDAWPQYNPFERYLEQLPRWDGQAHILAASVQVQVAGGTDEQLRWAECLRRWLVAMVAGWLEQDTVNHQILVLIGPQGCGKTTWLSRLLPPELRSYFMIKADGGRMERDDLVMVAEKGLICCEELDTMDLRDLNRLKAIVTAPYIDARAPYERYAERRPHTASFCGTGNKVKFLHDPTGNRRWLPFEVEGVVQSRDREPDHQGIFAEAYALWRSGDFRYWLSEEETRQLAIHNRRFERK